MSWIARKLDSLVGAIFAAFGGMACSQLQAFIHQYLQRLGGHVDEAQRNIVSVDSLALAEPSRQAVRMAAEARADDLQLDLNAIGSADALTQPYMFIRHMDWEIAKQAFGSYQPSIPIDAISLAYAAAGFVLGLLLYDLVKLPFGRRRRSRA